MTYNIIKLRSSSEALHDYIFRPSKAKEAFEKRRGEYILDATIIKELKRRAKDYSLIVFSAEWCPDCLRNVPVLDLISEATGLEVRVFGHIMRDNASTTRKWAVPPSPPEVDEFNVTKIPLIVILKKNGDKKGEIVENPPPGKTLEQTILELMK